MTREELIARAKELSLKFDEEKITETELQKIIADEEKKIKDDSKLSIDELKEKYQYKSDELDKAIKRRDAANSEKRKLQKQLAEAQELLSQVPKAEELKTLREELSALRDEKTKREADEEEKELAKKNEHEREIYRMSKEQESLKKEVETWREEKKTLEEQVELEKTQAQEKIKILRKQNLEAEIMSVASKHNAFNPNQIARLARDEFEYDKSLEKYIYVERDKNGKIKNEQDVDEFIGDFLSKEENENLVRSKMNNSSLNTKKNKSSSASTDDDFGDFDPNDPAIKERADLEDMTPERLIKVVLIPEQQRKQA